MTTIKLSNYFQQLNHRPNTIPRACHLLMTTTLLWDELLAIMRMNWTCSLWQHKQKKTQTYSTQHSWLMTTTTITTTAAHHNFSVTMADMPMAKVQPLND
jgi:hypothetical protein